MFVNKIQLKNSHYYSFSYICPKTKKRVRLKKSDHPLFTNEKDAHSWANSQMAHRAAEKTRNQIALKWKTQYHNFNELLIEFESWYKFEAPNSYKSAVNNLEKYVFLYFLQEKSCGNVAQWSLYYEEFKAWLRSYKSIRTEKEISYSTKNNIIKALNNFTTFLVRHNKINPQDVVTCKAFQKHLVKGRDFEDVVTDVEFEAIQSIFKDEEVSRFYYILRHTGMRFNELYSLEKSALYAGICGEDLQKELDKLYPFHSHS